MNAIVILGVIVAIIGVIILILVLFRKVKPNWTSVGIILTCLGPIISVLAWYFPRPSKLEKETEQRIIWVEKEVKEANQNIKIIGKRLGIPLYVDGLPSASPSVFDPFAKGVKLMIEYKWDNAITEFKMAMKEAKASQLVALYNLVGFCYYNSGKLDLSLENYNKSLSHAREFDDKEGEAMALGNLALIYEIRGI